MVPNSHSAAETFYCMAGGCDKQCLICKSEQAVSQLPPPAPLGERLLKASAMQDYNMGNADWLSDLLKEAATALSETRPSNDRYLAAAAECRLRAKLDPGARCGDVLLPAAELLEAAAQGGLSVAQTELEAIHALAMNPQDTAPKEGDPYTLSLLKQLLAIRLAPSAIGDTDYKALYMELLYAVANKWPEESRHQTALRYIRERENMPSDPKCASTDGNNTERQT